MREPKEIWQRVALTCESLLHLFEGLAGHRGLGPLGVEALLLAQKQVKELRDHIESSEECESD